MPTLTQLEYVVAVHRTKHFGRAAKECHVSQPSLSAQIQKVEEELDLILFDRSKKPVMTTALGNKIVDQARAVLREHRRIFDLRSEKGELAGEFSLGVIPTLAPYVIPLFVESFSKKYPKVNLRISEAQTEEIVAQLHDDQIDGALLVTPLKDDLLIERPIFWEPFYAFVSKEHALASKQKVNEKDIDSSSIWLLGEGHCFRDQVIKICSSRSKNAVLKNVSFESGSLETIKNLIRQGRGFTLLPHLATLNLSKSEREQQLKSFAGSVPTREVSLVRSRSFLKEDILSALEEEISLQVPDTLKDLKSLRGRVVQLA